jgi:hypothetical protein
MHPLCEGCVGICPWKCIHMLSTTAIDEAVNADQPATTPKTTSSSSSTKTSAPAAHCARPLPHQLIVLGKVTDQWRRRPQHHQPTRPYGVRF